MSGYKHLFVVTLGPRHAPTGRTTHRLGPEVLPAPASLAIVAYPEEDGCYLLYLGPDGEELTDTFHDSANAAMEQAEWEFGVLPNEWERRS